MDEIEKKLSNLIAENGDEKLMAAWLEYLDKKNEAAQKLSDRVSKKDPVIIGAAIGAIIGSLFKD